MKLIGVLVVLVGAIQLSEAEPANQCDPYCPYDYKPICAGPKEEDTHQPRIFSNECDLKQFNCKNDYNWEVKLIDKCSSFDGIPHPPFLQFA